MYEYFWLFIIMTMYDYLWLYKTSYYYVQLWKRKFGEKEIVRAISNTLINFCKLYQTIKNFHMFQMFSNFSYFLTNLYYVYLCLPLLTFVYLWLPLFNRRMYAQILCLLVLVSILYIKFYKFLSTATHHWIIKINSFSWFLSNQW